MSRPVVNSKPAVAKWLHARTRGAGGEATAGMTLLEVVLAVAIFAAVIGVTAQALMSFYLSMDMQEQRIEGLQSCRAVISALRDRRDDFKDNFPADLLTWVNQNNSSGWTDYLVSSSGHEELRNHTLEVLVLNMAGDAAGGNDVPVQVVVRSAWLDRRGRPMQAELVTVVNNE
ncbi:MAG: type II secretion system protein [Candidatus Hydrogenedentes bacterium]|nr:type II secretion system protein [Candidatus Hydrogenedentota bacterium]MBI3118870.1 type II secretion system protein [Candidatus Hydrogenedentota bacterium]